MAKDKELQTHVQRIGDMVERLEATADPHTRTLAKDLLESLMALHGAGLERLLQLASEAGETGEAIIRKCAQDQVVGSLLLLYGLHPESIETRVTRALVKLRHKLQAHGAIAELVSVDDAGNVRVRLQVQAGGCGSSAASAKATLETELRDAAPDAVVLVEESGAGFAPGGFVSVAQLQSGRAITALSAARTERSNV